MLTCRSGHWNQAISRATGETVSFPRVLVQPENEVWAFGIEKYFLRPVIVLWIKLCA